MPALRTEYSRTFANANSEHLTTEISSRAIFGRNTSGALAPIDTTLELHSGSVSPRVSAARVEFPADGSSTVAVRFRATKVDLSLPGALGVPTIDGSTATYSDVFPGVNLLLTATPEGMKQVYEVTTRAAAHNPKLRKLVLATHVSGARMVEAAGGGLAVLDHTGSSVFQGPAPIMWDSTSQVPDASDSALTRVFGSSRADEARHLDPAQGDRVSRMPMKVHGDRIEITPNEKLLTDPAAEFPVFIDPLIGLDRTERLMISSSGFEEYQFVGDEGMGRCPNSIAPAACGGSFIKRLYYEFPRETLNAGDEVLGAEFAVKETHSTSCSARPVWLRQTNQISSSTVWPGPATVRDLGERNVAYGYNSSCPDAEVAFRNSGVKTAAADLAAGTISRVTTMMRAENENDEYAWKRFADYAVLRVDYMRKPATPTAVGSLAGSAYTCATSSATRTLIGTLQPTLRAQPQTAVEAAGTTVPGLLKIKFELQRYDSPTATWVANMNGAPYRYRPAAGNAWVGDNATQYWKPSDDGITLAANTTYRFRALTQSHFDATSDVAGVTRESPWSGYCYFSVDPDAPLPPVVVSTDGVYPTDGADGSIQWGGGPGVPGSFGFTQNAADDDPNIEAFVSSVTDNAAISTTGTKSESATVTPSTYGPHVLSVTARDILDRNSSATTAYPFYVGTPSQPDGRWHVTDQDISSVANTGGLADAASPNPLLLSGSGVAVSAAGTGRRGNLADDRALNFTGAGTASASSGVVKTEKAVSFSAWVRLADLNDDATVLWRGTSDGATGLALRYVKATNAWSLDWRTPSTTAKVDAIGAAVAKVWTHLTATYNPDTDKLELLVNGRSAGTATAATIATTGPLSVGGLAGSTTLKPFRGYIDEPTVWQRTVSADEARILATTDFETGEPFYSLAGQWSTLTATSATLTDMSAFAGPSLVAEGGAALDSTDRLVTLDGVDDALTAAGPVVDETGSFTVQTNVSVKSAGLTSKPAGYKVRLAGQRGTVANGYASWAVWFEKISDNAGQVVFGRWKPATTTDPAVVVKSISEVTSTDQIVTLNAVYDANAKMVRLYTGEVELGAADYDPPSQGTGELAVGKGYQATGWADRSAMSVKGIRVWAGALTAGQLAQTGSEF